ncbi:MAG: 3-dehydroquinate synthase [Ignavibacteriaceae bacterium]
MKKIKVKLSKNSYDIIVGKNCYLNIVEEIKKLGLNKNILIIIDKNVKEYWEEYIKKPFINYQNRIEYYFLKPGESSKSYIELNRIYSFLLDNNFGRDTLVLAIGGGVTGDLGGYVASTFMRGVQLVHVPTTLLAAVDSSIGGKTGINFHSKKNMIGTFYQPESVLIDTNFISSLPRKEITSGLGEIIKYAFLSDDDFFDYLKENIDKVYHNDEAIINNLILKSALIKASVVSQDEKEAGLRKILNLGHTFAHAIESDLNFGIKHGEAVIAGIISALYLANKTGILKKDRMRDYLSLPLKIHLPPLLQNLHEKNMVNIMQLDKKSRNGEINFVLISETGNILIDVKTGENNILYSIERMKKAVNS